MSPCSNLKSILKLAIKDYSKISFGIVSLVFLSAIVFSVFPVESAQAQTTTTPDEPTGLTATAASSSKIVLTWNAPIDNGGYWITGYHIERQVDSGPWSTLIANTGASTSYTDSGLTPDTTYTYRVSALNGVYGISGALYADPGSDNSLSESWQRVYDAQVAYPEISLVITVNPDSGPGSLPRSDFEYAIPTLRSVGVTVLGYISTDWNKGAKTDAEVKSEIDDWVSMYGDGALGAGKGISGIMFDEMANKDEIGYNGDNVQWYTGLTDHAKNINGLAHTTGNPGTNTKEVFIGSVDQIRVHENIGTPDLDDLFDDWKLNYPISNFVIIPHSTPILDEDLVMNSHQYMTHIYIQDDGADGSNHWDTLSSFFERIVEIQDEANNNSGGASVPTNEVSETTPPTVSLTIQAIDSNGDPIGMWSGIKLDGTTIDSGNTPKSFQIDSGTEYTAFAGNFEQYIFDYWEDSSTDSDRLITITEDTTITAYYQIIDTTAPIITVPSDIFTETSSYSGTEIIFTVSAEDNVDDPITPTCDQNSANIILTNLQTNIGTTDAKTLYAIFPLGSTLVMCSATDSSGNTGLAAFTVTVDLSLQGDALTSNTEINLTIQAIDSNGDVRSLWNVLYLDGNQIDEGFTPESYQITSGVEYSVFAANYKQYTFDHWEDGSTDNPRMISIDADKTFTAFYNAS